MKVFYTDRSKTDLQIAFTWYEKQLKGLGLEFLNCIEASVNKVSQFPELYQIKYSCFRACPIRRFPFSIYYSIENEQIVIHSIFDNRLNPQKKP